MIILSLKLFFTVSESLHAINGRPASLVNFLLTYSDTERALQRVIPSGTGITGNKRTSWIPVFYVTTGIVLRVR